MSVSVLNTTSSLSGKTLLKAEDTQTITGQKTFDLGASAPFVVVSGGAKVANLDADQVDGEDAADLHDSAQLTGQVPIASGGTGAATAAANLAFIGPASGAAASPSFRALVAADDSTEQTTTATGAQNDFVPSAGALVIIRCTGAAPVFSGFTGGAAGRRILLQCLGTTLKITDQATSSAANQIICESTAGQIVGVNGMILLVYDGTTARWRAQLLDPGAAIAWTPTIGGSGGESGQAYTTQVGRYIQRGRQVSIWFTVQLSTLGTITTSAQIKGLPFTSENVSGLRAVAVIEFTNFTSTLVFCAVEILANTSVLSFLILTGAATSVSNAVQADLSNTTFVAGSLSHTIA